MMADGAALERQIADLFARQLQLDVPAADTDLFEVGILDSLRFVGLLAALETTFGIHVAVEDLEIDDFRSLSRIAQFVEAKTAQATATGRARGDAPTISR